MPYLVRSKLEMHLTPVKPDIVATEVREDSFIGLKGNWQNEWQVELCSFIPTPLATSRSITLTCFPHGYYDLGLAEF